LLCLATVSGREPVANFVVPQATGFQCMSEGRAPLTLLLDRRIESAGDVVQASWIMSCSVTCRSLSSPLRCRTRPSRLQPFRAGLSDHAFTGLPFFASTLPYPLTQLAVSA